MHTEIEKEIECDAVAVDRMMDEEEKKKKESISTNQNAYVLSSHPNIHTITIE